MRCARLASGFVVGFCWWLVVGYLLWLYFVISGGLGLQVLVLVVLV